MSVVIETTLGDLTVDLFLADRPRSCLNFLKLCKIKYYNFNLFHTISRGFIAQTGDPTGSRTGGESIFGILEGPDKRYFAGEKEPRIKHTKMGLISFVGDDDSMVGSQFFLTLGEDLTYLDPKHCVFGEVVEGYDILEVINETICDTDDRPYQDVRITHTVILDDPYPDPKTLIIPSRSPSPTAERLQGGRIAPDEEIDEMEGKTTEEMVEVQAEKEAKARATILEMVGDIPDAEMAPPENVLFVCKLNPITTDDDLEIIFNRFGKIKSCEVIRDKKTGDSLQYAFIEFADQKSCEDAYFKMDNILIDDRRIHVDFSQSVSKIKWNGKGRGVTYYNPNNDKFEETDSSYFKQSRNKNRTDQDDSEIKKYRYSDSSRTHKDSKKRGSDRSNFDRSGRDKSNKRDYRRKSRSISPKRAVSRQQRRSRSAEGRHEKTRYERNDRYSNDVYKRNSKKKYDGSSDSEDKKTKRKTAQSRRSAVRELERKNARKSKLKNTNKKSDKKRNDTSSDFDSEIEKHKTEKRFSKNEKERRKQKTSSETSDSSEKAYKNKSRKQSDKKKTEKKKYGHSSDSSDSEDKIKKRIKKKSKSKRSKDYSSDSDRDKRIKSDKRKRS